MEPWRDVRSRLIDAEKAQSSSGDASSSSNPRTAAAAMLDSLDAQMVALLLPSILTRKSREAAATSRNEAANARATAARSGREAPGHGGHPGRPICAWAAPRYRYGHRQPSRKPRSRTAKIWLDNQSVNYDIRGRFGVRKRFRSYDLWRARALSENARRLSVAARRAIESRYVVDLSNMNAPEAFVDAPALWADDIYGSDLKPPVALGLTKGATVALGSLQ